jgi:hypothetical protein
LCGVVAVRGLYADPQADRTAFGQPPNELRD